jgi:LmbE family N-acetylglucosaminyl deacetylase
MGKAFLAALRRSPEKLDASAVCVVVAHPDDETLGCGGQLHRLEGLTVILVTDGAPRNLRDAKACGFETAAAYAQARASEFHHVMKLANIDNLSILTLGVADQQAARCLTWLTGKLAAIFSESRIGVAITHAFEGGHPDHDAVAFSVHAARDLLRRRGHDVDVLEFPLYRAGDNGIVLQSFAPPAHATELQLQLDEAARNGKQRLLHVYTTQRETLSVFATETETFRLAENYDFTLLPNHGRVLYESYDWGLTGSEWCALARHSLQQLALEH